MVREGRAEAKQCKVKERLVRYGIVIHARQGELDRIPCQGHIEVRYTSEEK